MSDTLSGSLKLLVAVILLGLAVGLFLGWCRSRIKTSWANLPQVLDRYAVDNWRVAHKLWSVRIAIFWSIFSGLWVALPAFQGVISPIYFALLCIGFTLTLLFARLTHQPGLED